MTVAELETMDRAALIAAWSGVFKRPAPKGVSQSYLRRVLATELQARRYGGLPPRIRSLLAEDGKTRRRRVTPGLKPGGRLLREWNGVTHVVEVTEDGFVWNETRHRSLSAIARAITGARWSGPRFFGLTRKER